MQRTGSRVDSNGFAARAVGGKLFFELGHFRSQGELAAFENAGDGGIDLRLDAVVLRFQVSVRNHD